MSNKSQQLFAQARELLPGGVNSPVRACLSVQTYPLFIDRGEGSRLFSADGDEYIDYVLSWGPLILGHSHPQVIKSVQETLLKGSSFGAPCQLEVDLAKEIIQALPGIEKVRMVSSGTEATMSALRLARGWTGRDKIVKFIGCYHGHVDALLAQAGSGVATLSIPGTPGIPKEVVQHTLLVPYNDLEAVNDLFTTQGEEIAAVIVEPVAGNMGLVLPQPGFLQGLREITTQHQSLLIFDEVITGFRVSYQGAQGFYDITPDLTCLGKIIGGGFPVGAFGGKREIMDFVAPMGKIYQAGTLSGNPVAMAAGLATLKILKSCNYQQLAERTRSLVHELLNIFQEKGLAVTMNCLASAFTLFFCEGPVTNFSQAQASDQKIFQAFYQQMRNQGIYLAPSPFECAFTSFAHSDDDFERTLEAARKIDF